ncbi:ABC transporter substrate-binding protein [Pelagibacterium xiamenense]|uniref:ABC transporter substrate-binding protein n=1 Tax=Pelagibacterium xiamenense TaxID=2901140 RepID=UPI001E5558F6|nr:ABC transporter substrate-binding protein [Pelagibacterium xiamenense]MCD7060161.1 ABC transporter substrate-binding protein [Pelagibacterium xiamenense]
MLNRKLFSAVAGITLFGASFAAPVLAQTTPVRFTLDWRFEGPAAGFILAEENGYFAEEGLDVTIDTGNGSVEAIPRVATGTYDMGFGDINSLIKFLDEDPSQPVKAVMMIYETPTFAVVGRKSLGVTEDPASLEGKTLGAPPPDGAFAQWPAFVEVAGIDTSEITIESIGFPVREPMLAQGEVDAVFGFAFSVILNLKAQGVPDEDIATILMAEHGLDLYGNAILVNTDFAEANPDVVEGMLRALTKGFADAVADPAAGAAAVVAWNDILDVDVETERLEMANAMNINTAYVQENGIGGVDMERLARSIEFLKLSIGLSDAIAAEQVFDASYLPPQEERMLP